MPTPLLIKLLTLALVFWLALVSDRGGAEGLAVVAGLLGLLALLDVEEQKRLSAVSPPFLPIGVFYLVALVLCGLGMRGQQAGGRAGSTGCATCAAAALLPAGEVSTGGLCGGGCGTGKGCGTGGCGAASGGACGCSSGKKAASKTKEQAVSVSHTGASAARPQATPEEIKQRSEALQRRTMGTTSAANLPGIGPNAKPLPLGLTPKHEVPLPKGIVPAAAPVAAPVPTAAK